VWGVCRRVLRDHHDAEDAFQATFLVLVRKAASIASREQVANWLYGVAHRTALKARATAAKRKGRERQVAAMPEPAADEAHWSDLQPLLDHELSQLPDHYRTVLVLCDLQGRTRKEAAGQLGVPEGTVAGWLARAREMLAQRLARRGLTVPTRLEASTINAAVLFAAGQAGAIAPAVVALTEGVLESMLVSKTKLAMVLILVILLGVGFGLLRTTAAERPAPSPAEPKRGVKVKWEYKAISPEEVRKLAAKGAKDRLTEGLNQLGDEGWELVAVQPGAPSALGGSMGSLPSVYLFKRPK
jgi:RNA polymerase sigma factor (sigma-70 family)